MSDGSIIGQVRGLLAYTRPLTEGEFMTTYQVRMRKAYAEYN
jgi:hypothetical protein